jgi:hypothetical protein
MQTGSLEAMGDCLAVIFRRRAFDFASSVAAEENGAEDVEAFLGEPGLG